MMWRVLLAAAGVAMMAGGPRHPGGTMLEMLQHEDWFLAHLLVAIGYALMTAGLIAFSRTALNTPALARWTKLAIIGTVLQTIEMIVHTAAMVDAPHLAAGHATPVLTTHLVMAVLFYPVFGATTAVFFYKGMRERAIGSVWYTWLGLVGTVANGLAPVLVVLFGIMQARILFPMMVGIALYLILAAVTPSSAGAKASAYRQRPASL